MNYKGLLVVVILVVVAGAVALWLTYRERASEEGLLLGPEKITNEVVLAP